MIQKIILINSANFNFLEVNLEKDLFFLGDNGSGKTTVIRAIHYLFSGDVRNLGIPTDKDGFKEYYFRYPNSYMIYVFNDFFIFMYKAGGEIVKLFSKQKFDIDRVINTESNLYELDIIKKYAKTPNMKKTVKSLSEYRDIIYGNDKRYLDFKFTSVKNSSVFIGLFNEIFNIDKSIIDSKSIKRAIQTTLNTEKKVLEFEHDKYLQDIYTFQSQYKFFREFEKQKENIEGAYEIKNILLSYEEELHTLVSYILSVSTQERELLETSRSRHIEIDRSFTRTKRLKLTGEARFTKCDESYKGYINTLSLDIQEIQGLKAKFSRESVLLHNDSADKYEETQEKHSGVKEQYIKLKSGFEDEIESIESEIKSLRYKKEKELPRELENKKENKRKFLKNQVDEKIESEELAFKTKENIAKGEIETIRTEIKAFDEDVLRETKELNAYVRKSKLDIKSINEQYEKEEQKKKALIVESEDFRDTKRREIKELEFNKEELERDKHRTLRTNAESFESEKANITQAIAKYTRMINAKPNSLKEFLNEEADGWEYELYPFMDEILLDRSVDELAPSIVNQERLLSLSMQTDTLKKILTKDEAALKIESNELELENLSLSYEKSLGDIELKFKDKQEEIEEKVLFLESDRETKRESILKLEEEIVELTTTKEKALLDFNAVYTKQYKQHQNNISAFHDEVQNSKDTISEIEEGVSRDKQGLRSSIKELEEEFDELLALEYETLQKWLESQEQRVDEFITVQVEKKSSITQDERLAELENSLGDLDNKLTEIRASQLFLEEYEKSKLRIESLLSLENELINSKLRFKNFRLKIEAKIEEYEYKIESLSEEKKV
ncbi:MAG: hypothetical protein U9O86_01180 [Campylobacterota bacterium]|nr:hypothetical protein [Campylobacterota bacterium]